MVGARLRFPFAHLPTRHAKNQCAPWNRNYLQNGGLPDPLFHSQVSEERRGEPGNRNPGKVWAAIMTEFAFYLDDGGHPDDQPFLVVAGYVATELRWLAFEPQWRAALNKFELGDEFHMTDFMRARYTALKRDQILSELALITKHHTLHPFMCCLDIAAYGRVNEEFALEESHGAPFALTFRALKRAMHIWENQNFNFGDRSLTFIEQGTKHYGDLEKVCKRAGIPIPHRVPKEMPQVQPSDILAWETFKWLKDGSPRKQGKNLSRLTRQFRFQEHLGGMLYEHDLRRICEDTNVPPRSVMTPESTIVFHSNLKRKRKRTIK